MHKQTHDLSDDLEKIKAALVDASEDIKFRAGEILSDSAENVKNKSVEIQDTASIYIAEKPFRSVGIALLSGMVIGFLLRK